MDTHGPLVMSRSHFPRFRDHQDHSSPGSATVLILGASNKCLDSMPVPSFRFCIVRRLIPHFPRVACLHFLGKADVNRFPESPCSQVRSQLDEILLDGCTVIAQPRLVRVAKIG